MSDIVRFVPRADRNAAANLEAFIRFAREDLTAFGGEGGAWDSNRWKYRETVALFGTLTQRNTMHALIPFEDPFLQFAKAYIRYRYSHQPVVSVGYWLMALRCIERALVDSRGTADIAALNGAVMDCSAAKCREHYPNKEIQHKAGLVMASIFDFCRELHLVPSLPRWRSPFRKPAILTEDVGEAGKRHRERKLPTNESMFKLAELFAAAKSNEERYFTSIFALLMVAPSRISEVLSLPIDCIQWEDDDSGTPQMFLRWDAAKGMGATKKWIVPAMHSVVEEAVRRLREIGEPAREAALFAYRNPDEFPPFGDREGFSPQSILTRAEVASALAVDILTVTAKWMEKVFGSREPTRGHLVSYVHKRYCGFSWPFVNEKSDVMVWQALCLHREMEFHETFNPRPFSWRLPKASEVNGRMGICGSVRSLFERAGVSNQDGSPVKLSSHKLRHWLSTMSERSGMDEYTLAQWAGRAKVSDNRHYDHRSTEERAESARSVLAESGGTELEIFHGRAPVTRQELDDDRLRTAHVTLYGKCLHDYAMAPCQKQRECMTCKEHVCIKGDHVTLGRIKVLEEQTAHVLARADEAHAEGVFGTDRWRDDHRWKLAHVRSMRLALEADSIPDGSALRIPEGHDPSPMRRVLHSLGALEGPSLDSLPEPQCLLPKECANDAEEDNH